MKRATPAAAGAVIARAMPAGDAGAHNAAHLILPDGTCHEVGSNKDAPIVGAGNPNQIPPLDNFPVNSISSPATATRRRPLGRRPQHTLLPGNCP